MPKTPDSRFDEKLIRKLATLLTETGLTEIEYENAGFKIRVASNNQNTNGLGPDDVSSKSSISHRGQGGIVPDNKQSNSLEPGTITAPMVGIAYLSSDPKSSQFVKENDKVEAGQTLMLIEAMKVFNQIKSSKAGVVEKILVESGSPVEFGEPLIIIT